MSQVSNFRPQDLEELMAVAKTAKPVVNQIEYHPYVLSHLDKVMELHNKVRSHIHALPLSAALLTRRLIAFRLVASQHNILTAAYGPLSPLLRHKTGGPLKPILERIAVRLSKETGRDVDAAAVLLLWTRAKGVIAVTASGNAGRIQKLADSQQLPELDIDEVEEIERVGRTIYFRAYVSRSCSAWSCVRLL